ncbi:MAG: flagellar protein FliS [Desulfobacterales bacterium]|nr:flagellar protein FliS [Desulfobacterales bacterium]
MTSTHPTPPEDHRGLSQDEMIQMIDRAMKYLTRANDSPQEQQVRRISAAVHLLTQIRDHHTPSDNEDAGDFSTLFDYMVDRLSISHSGLAIDPINEVTWLLKNLRDLLSKPKHSDSPTEG